MFPIIPIIISGVECEEDLIEQLPGSELTVFDDGLVN